MLRDRCSVERGCRRRAVGQAGSCKKTGRAGAAGCGKVRRVVAICGSGAVCGVWVCCRGRWAGLGWGVLVCCNASQGRTRQAMQQGSAERQGSRQGTAVRRIEGFEKRRSAKPKRCLSHPPWLRSCVSGSTYAPGECRVVLSTAGATWYALPCAWYLSFAGVSLRRPRLSCCAAVSRRVS
jgi:hypothetical protein